MDRAHRIGQTKPVVVYRFMAEGTVRHTVHYMVHYIVHHTVRTHVLIRTNIY